MTQAQVKQITNVWGGLTVTYKDALYTSLPLTTAYQNTIGAQYWQWANGMVTTMAGAGDTIEAAIGTQYFAGYYEFSYWKAQYFNIMTNPANVGPF